MQYWVEQQTGGHIATNSSFLAKTEDSHLSSPWARYISCILVKSKNRRQSCLCYTLNLSKKHHIVDISLNYVNFLLKQPLLHEIHDLLAFHYLKELIFQETTISLSKGCYSSRKVPKAFILIKTPYVRAPLGGVSDIVWLKPFKGGYSR